MKDINNDLEMSIFVTQTSDYIVTFHPGMKILKKSTR